MWALTLTSPQVVVIDEDHTDDESISAGSAFLARVLQYQETPQYLRKCGSTVSNPASAVQEVHMLCASGRYAELLEHRGVASSSSRAGQPVQECGLPAAGK